MSELYPLKLEPFLKEKIWGGAALVNRYHKKADPNLKYGESWELSAVSDNLSVVCNGFLAGNNIEELIEVYMGDITGDTVFEKFGNEFPLLIKLIEAREDLSIQVHPGNNLAKERHQAYGKTEMWYILESERNSKIFTGFKDPVTREYYIESVKNGNIADLMNVENPVPGDTFFTPAGRIHAIGAGIVLVEIQQTSDITYRIFDWNRKNPNGKSRELHAELALDAIDFAATGKNKIKKELILNKTENLVSCEFFNTNIISFNERIEKDYNLIDSFVVYICIDGEFLIRWDGNSEPVTKGETVLLPAMIKEVMLEPVPESKLLEIFIKTNLSRQSLNN
ncbi:MAG: class I mannose-6-phosphate isomerase [Bacteroidales bacterium]|nr:class I mannose-6-phosphate isomerase [Bacteroidales bacterium]